MAIAETVTIGGADIAAKPLTDPTRRPPPRQEREEGVDSCGMRYRRRIDSFPEPRRPAGTVAACFVPAL